MKPEHATPETWPAIHALLKPAMEYADYDAITLIDDLLDHTCQLWVDREGGAVVGAGVTELRHTAEGLVLAVLLYGGRISRLRPTLAYARQQAEQIGAVAIEMEGRKGWRRVLANEGYRRAGIVMRLDLAGAH